MLNSSAEYALKATHLLARIEPGERRTAEELATELDLPANFLSKLLSRLRQRGILESRPGPSGGFRLAREPSEVTLAEVAGPFDDLVRDRQCLLGRPECRDDAPCAAHERWKELADRVERFFRETTLADLDARPRAGSPAGNGRRAGEGRTASGGSRSEGEETA